MPSHGTGLHERFLRRQEAGACYYLVAVENGVAVGSGLLNWDGGREAGVRAAFPGVPVISNLGVLADRRNEGVGSALLAAAEELAADRGHPSVAIAVGVDNPDAARLYRRRGYADTGFGYESRYTWTDADRVEHPVVERDVLLLKPL